MTVLTRSAHSRRPDWPKVRMPLLAAADLALLAAGWFAHAGNIAATVLFVAAVAPVLRWYAIR